MICFLINYLRAFRPNLSARRQAAEKSSRILHLTGEVVYQYYESGKGKKRKRRTAVRRSFSLPIWKIKLSNKMILSEMICFFNHFCAFRPNLSAVLAAGKADVKRILKRPGKRAGKHGRARRYAQPALLAAHIVYISYAYHAADADHNAHICEQQVRRAARFVFVVKIVRAEAAEQQRQKKALFAKIGVFFINGPLPARSVKTREIRRKKRRQPHPYRHKLRHSVFQHRRVDDKARRHNHAEYHSRYGVNRAAPSVVGKITYQGNAVEQHEHGGGNKMRRRLPAPVVYKNNGGRGKNGGVERNEPRP